MYRFIAALVYITASEGQPLTSSYVYHVDDAVLGTAFNLKYKTDVFTITNWHICRHTSNKTLRMISKTNQVKKEKILLQSLDKDLCVLTSSDSEGLIPGIVTPGDNLTVIGHPNSSALQVTAGGRFITDTVDNLAFPSHECPFLITPGARCIVQGVFMDTTVPGARGNSGSPFINDLGKVVGYVNSVTNDSHQTLSGFHIQDAIRLIEEWKAQF